VESLKNFDEIYLPDVRHRNRVNVDTSTGEVSEFKLDDIYSLIEAVCLNDNVPEEIRSHFETAKNLIIYSWFVYSFNTVAALHALASLEMAVKAKTGDGKTAFKSQLDKVFKSREFAPGQPLSKVVAYIRNDLAHGSSTIHGQEHRYVSMCADLINELYQ
jgi:hypothetical protein